MKTIQKKIFTIGIIVILVYVFYLFSHTEQKNKPQAYTLAVEVVYPTTKVYSDSIIATGEIAAQEITSISTEINGLQLNKILVKVGDHVQKGQILAILEDRFVHLDVDIQKAQLKEAFIALQEAKKNAKRARQLKSTGAMSEKEITSFIAAEQTAKTKYDAIQALLNKNSLQLQHTQITAPYNGIILSKTANEGEIIGIGQELFRLMRPGKLEWHARLRADDLVKIKKQDKVKIYTVDGKEYTGTIRTIDPGLDAKSHDAKVYVSLSATLEDKLFPGMFAKGEFILAEQKGLSIPNDAMVMRDGKSYVFTVDHKNIVHQIPIQIISFLSNGIIVSNIKPTDKIIVKGGEFLKAGDIVKISNTNFQKIRKIK